MPLLLKDILLVLFGLIAGAIAGFFLARKYLVKYLEKNPPINEEMIKALMMQMGRKPSQKQIKQMMNTMNKFK